MEIELRDAQIDGLKRWGIPIPEELTKSQADQILRDLSEEKQRRLAGSKAKKFT